MNKIIITTLVFLTAFQAGFLFRSYLEYKNGAVPIITPSELIKLMEE